MLKCTGRRRPVGQRVAVLERGGRAAGIDGTKRVFWGLSDQAISSLTNFAVSVIAARAASPSSFGAFSVVFATYLIALGVVRGLVSAPLVIRHSGVSARVWSDGVMAATGSAIGVGLCGSVMCILAAGLLHGTLSDGFEILAIGLPGLLLQDTWRFAFFAERRGSLAFTNDILWAVLLLSLFLVGGASHTISVKVLIGVWALSGGIAGVFGCVQARLVPRPLLIAHWFKTHADLGIRYAIESLATTGATQATFFAIGGVIGLSGLAVVRGAYVLLGPLNILLLGTMAMGIPEAVRLIKRWPDRTLLFAASLSAGLASVALIVGGILLLVPDRIGTALIGNLWILSHEVLLPVTLAMSLAGVSTGAMMFLAGLAAARLSLRAALIYSPVALGTSTVGAALAGPSGACWGLVVGQLTAAVLLWFALAHAATNPSGGAAEVLPSHQHG